MAKTFKFDAIGRDLYPGERQAAQEFTRKYQSPPTQAVTHREMTRVAGHVLKAASARISASATLKASATVTRGGRLQGSAKSIAGSALTAKALPKRSTKVLLPKTSDSK